MHDRRPAGPPTATQTRVGDVMSTPIVTCQADVTVAEVAELMARHRIHAVVVVGESDPGMPGAWRVMADIDLVRAVAYDARDAAVGRLAATPAITVPRDRPLHEAALLMSEHETTHVIAVEDGHPVGIVSALDVAVSLSSSPRGAAAEPAPPPPARAGGDLRAEPGDRLVIHGHHLGEPERDAEVLEARGAGGGAPFLVRWGDTGHTTLLYPGSDARVQRPRGPAGG